MDRQFSLSNLHQYVVGDKLRIYLVDLKTGQREILLPFLVSSTIACHDHGHVRVEGRLLADDTEERTQGLQAGTYLTSPVCHREGRSHIWNQVCYGGKRLGESGHDSIRVRYP